MTNALFRILLLGSAFGLGLMPVAGFGDPAIIPELVTVPAGVRPYRASGEYLKDGRAVDAPMIRITLADPLEIMKYQVSAGDYALCVADSACDAALRSRAVGKDLPVTGVSFKDATDYAKWFGRKTGYSWRLPSDEEWAVAAGSRFVDDALGGGDPDPENPSQRWLLKYRKYNDPDFQTSSELLARGSFGANENGIYDMSANVWEWTSSCYVRSTMDESGGTVPNGKPNCGVRIAEGQHRAYITFFVKDAKGGGCSVGAPPDYLGFRLVRDTPHAMSIGGIRSWWRAKLQD